MMLQLLLIHLCVTFLIHLLHYVESRHAPAAHDDPETNRMILIISFTPIVAEWVLLSTLYGKLRDRFFPDPDGE